MYDRLLTVIVNFGKGSNILSLAKKNGIDGGTILLGMGSVRKPILELLSLCDVRKELVYILGKNDDIGRFMSELDRVYHFKKENTGVCFTTEVRTVHGVHHEVKPTKQQDKPHQEEENKLYDLITVIVDRGRADEVIEISGKLGARGGTIVHGRGSGVHETQKIFSIAIEPEKEIVLIAVDHNLTDELLSKIDLTLNLDAPGTGVLYVQEIKSSMGIK